MRLNKKAIPMPIKPVVVIETLEPRRLLSVSLDKGLLAVAGTSRNDAIVVTVGRKRVEVQVNRERKSFRLRDIKSIKVSGDSGNDRIRLNGTLGGRCRIEGNSGNDTLLGGQGAEILLGGDGQDYLRGNGGDDSIGGGRGDDAMRGDGGKDALYGEAGNDDLYGGTGDDRVDGGSGHDNLEGGRGTDQCWGRSGRDVFHSGDKRDEIKDRKSSDDSSMLVSPSQVPAAAMAAFKVAYPNVALRKVELEDEHGVLAYEFSFVHDGTLKKAKLDAAGNLIEGEMSFEDLPAAVKTAFTSQFPGATVNEVKFELEGSESVYRIEFVTTEGQRGRARYQANGAGTADDDGEHISFDQLPEAVKMAFRRVFPGVTVREAESETEHGATIYKISFFDALGLRQRARFDVNGKWLDW